jgi:antitoxin component YwqK of YwqJK toxin-antitoxin module
VKKKIKVIMRSLVLIIVSALYTSLIFAQGIDVKKSTPCYEKAKTKGSSRFAEWECGKLAGVVDCNEKLTYDEDTKTILSGNMGTPFTGTCETCHLNGLLERRISFVNGKENGIDTTYYKSGCPQVVRNHIQGAESGQWFYFYDSTQRVAWEMNYNIGQKNGKQIYLTKDGDTTRLEYYNNGKLSGAKKSYYPKSKIEKEITYKEGLMDGPFKAYSMEGKPLQELNYKQGKKNGELKYYYNDGTLLSTEHWTMDVRDGEFKTFYYEGNLQNMENYKKGIPEGWFEERWPDDKLKRRALYKKGELIEEHRYDEHGVENYTFGVETASGSEDDAMPGSKKKKKKKKDEQNKGGLIKME